jgi:hypothetical protein
MLWVFINYILNKNIMILPFLEKINGNKTYFAEKILKTCISNDISILGKFEKTTKQLNFLKACASTYNVDLNFDLDVYQKKHTIRKDLKNRWKTGNKIHAVYNNRQKNQFQFAPIFECKGIQQIKIEWIREDNHNLCLIFIDKSKYSLTYNETNTLALNDGFESADEFFEFFKKDFEGKIIHFTNLRY